MEYSGMNRVATTCTRATLVALARRMVTLSLSALTETICSGLGLRTSSRRTPPITCPSRSSPAVSRIVTSAGAFLNTSL